MTITNHHCGKAFESCWVQLQRTPNGDKSCKTRDPERGVRIPDGAGGRKSSGRRPEALSLFYGDSIHVRTSVLSSRSRSCALRKSPALGHTSPRPRMKICLALYWSAKILFSEYFLREVSFLAPKESYHIRTMITRIHRTLWEQYSNGRSEPKTTSKVTNFSNFRLVCRENAVEILSMESIHREFLREKQRQVCDREFHRPHFFTQI